MKRRARLVLSLLPEIVSLALALGVAALWVRSHWTTDDWFLVYRAGCSEQVRAWRGYVVVRHTTPAQGESRGGVARLTHYAVRTDSLPPDVLTPGSTPPYPDHRRWGPVRYDALTAARLGAAAAAQRNILARGRARDTQLQQQLAQLVKIVRVGPENSQERRVRAEIDRVGYERLQSALLGAIQLNQMTTDAQYGAIPSPGPYTTPRWQVAFPAWVPLALCLLLPAAWLLRRLRARRRRRAGRCARCGYDLRASAERCPECGESIPNAAGAAPVPANQPGAPTEALADA